MRSPDNSEKSILVKVTFADDQSRDMVLSERDKTGETIDEYFNNAVALLSWWRITRSSGGRILVEHPNGRIREIIGIKPHPDADFI